MRINFILILLLCACVLEAQSNMSGTQLKKGTGPAEFLVRDQPLLVLGGELGNSSASNADYLLPYWPHLQIMHLNTVLVPLYWESWQVIKMTSYRQLYGIAIKRRGEFFHPSFF